MKIGVLNGDHIGHEVAPEAVKVLPAAAAATGVPTQNSES
jgi:isocitrate/isopropylmalate dehydrogenase